MWSVSLVVEICVRILTQIISGLQRDNAMQSSQLWIKHKQVFIFPVRWGLRSNGGTGGLSVLLLSSCSYHYYHSRVNNQLSGQEGKTCYNLLASRNSCRSTGWTAASSPLLHHNIGYHSPTISEWWTGDGSLAEFPQFSVNPQMKKLRCVAVDICRFLFLTIFWCPTHLMIGIITITVGTTHCPKSYKFGI